MKNAVILDAVRTPIGRFQGGLAGVRADDLGALAITELLRRTGIDPARVDEVFLGCANQAGEDNRNVARMAGLLAGLPQSVPGVTVNRLCASGLEAVNQAARALQVGDMDLCIAGGVENMSRSPYVFPRGPVAPKAGNITGFDTTLGWRFPNPKMEALFPLEAMGCTAENLVDDHSISRDEQDAFSLASHQKALKAQEQGWFDGELFAVEIPQRRGDPRVVSADEGPRAGTSMERLGKLRAAFRKGGSVTAGNSSTLNDGSAAVLVSTPEMAKELGLTPRFRIVAKASAGAKQITFARVSLIASRLPFGGNPPARTTCETSCFPQMAIKSIRSGCMVIRFTPNGLLVSFFVSVISVSSNSGVIAPQAITPKPPALEIALTRLRSDTHDIAPHIIAVLLPSRSVPRFMSWDRVELVILSSFKSE